MPSPRGSHVKLRESLSYHPRLSWAYGARKIIRAFPEAEEVAPLPEKSPQEPMIELNGQLVGILHLLAQTLAQTLCFEGRGSPKLRGPNESGPG